MAGGVVVKEAHLDHLPSLSLCDGCIADDHRGGERSSGCEELHDSLSLVVARIVCQDFYGNGLFERWQSFFIRRFSFLHSDSIWSSALEKQFLYQAVRIMARK